MRCVLSPLVTVQLQLLGDLFLFHGSFDSIQHKIYRLFRTGLVGNDTVVAQISDHRKIQNTLLCLYVRNVGNPLLIRSCSAEISVKQIRLAMKLLTHYLILTVATDASQKIVFVH